MSDQYPTGTYVKDGRTKTANTPAKAVALVFQGYRLVEEAPAEQVQAPETVADNPTPTPHPEAETQ